MMIRPEAEADAELVRAINETAFPGPEEAGLVDALRGVEGVISLVAEEEGAILGHILFSPVALSTNPGQVSIAGLAPMAVLPERQNGGIGSALVRAGLQACKDQGYQAVVVLGHPHYYPRFGFVSASSFGIRSEYDVPENVFMAQELMPGALNGVGGVIRYHAAFAGV